MKSFVKSLLSARADLVAEFAKQSALLEKRLGHLDALLQENDVDTSKLGGLKAAAPGKKRGRKPGSGKKAAAVKEVASAGAKEGKKAAKKAGKGRGKSGFNATAAVRAVVADMSAPFTVGDLRAEFEKRHPGVLATLNRVALSLAMQSLGRKGEVTSKKDPNGKGNLFSKTSKLKV
jgi:hypothetical protein